MSRSKLLPLFVVALAACADDTSAPRTPVSPDLNLGVESRGLMRRYVAIGTSISMGWQSDGLVESDQRAAWPTQLAATVDVRMPQPLIQSTGCRSPLRAPLASGVRLSGEPAGAPAASFSCAALVPNAETVRNVAIASATTRDALFTTPELQLDPFYSKLYPRVLKPGATQLSTALALDPKVLSIEFGGNEVLNARSGIAIPGVTITPFATWAPQYTQLVGALVSPGRKLVLSSLIADVGSFPSFRRGSELWADRTTFLAAFHVNVAADCDASSNLLFIPVRVPTAVAAGLTARAQGQPPVTLSCADGGIGVQDFVLSSAEQGVVNATLAAMNAHIIAVAAQHDVAHFALDALYGRGDLKPPFSVVQLMTSAAPYGSYTSLDGIHPSGLGHTVLAAAAATALNARYGMGLPVPSTSVFAN